MSPLFFFVAANDILKGLNTLFQGANAAVVIADLVLSIGLLERGFNDEIVSAGGRFQGVGKTYNRLTVIGLFFVFLTFGYLNFTFGPRLK